MTKRFLTAEWQHLILLNYTVPDELLKPWVPAGTELDYWNGEAYVSLVGFLFADTRLLGVPVPGHRVFEEVNLRFYVKRRSEDGEVRRAVVFIRELVPRWAIAWVARTIYNEPYLSLPMAHHSTLDPDRGGDVEYSWRFGGQHFRMQASVQGPARAFVVGSEQEFITEHYWGYTRQRDGGTLEYQVEHPPWRVWDATRNSFEGPGNDLYGNDFGEALKAPPKSAFVAVGSPIIVRRGRRIST